MEARMSTDENSLNRARWPRSLKFWGDTLGPLIALILVFAFFAVAESIVSRRAGREPHFLEAGTIRSIAVNSSLIGVCALGMTIVIIAGGIDLSVGNGICLCATILACCLKLDWEPTLAVLATLLAGCALGAINGGLVSLLRVVPFIITLGTMTIYLGVGKWLAHVVENGGQTVRPKTIPPWLKSFTSTLDASLWPPKTGWAAPDAVLEYLRFPLGIWLGLLLAVLVAALLNYTVFGRRVFALGSNEATARLCGISVSANRIWVYLLGGLFVGIAGVYQFSRLKAGEPNGNSALELRIIAAVVIGGGSLSGGRGSILGTMCGAALMTTIVSGCGFLGISNQIQDIVLGGMIVAAVTLDQLRQRKT